MFWMNQCHRRKVAGLIRTMVNARGLQIDRGRTLHETLVMPVLMYSSKTKIIWKVEAGSRIRTVQINLRGLLGL